MGARPPPATRELALKKQKHCRDNHHAQHNQGGRSMRCFRVDEQAAVGIPLTTSPEGLYIEVGDEHVMLDPDLTQRIQTAREQVLLKIKECLYTERIGIHQLTPEELEELMDMEEQAQDQLSLLYVDVEEGKLVRERTPSPKALVLVETSPGIGGRISFKSTAFDEVCNPGSTRVWRRYREDFPPPGVQVVAEGENGKKGKCLLVQMIPGSSFRIERTGELEGAPGVLTVAWKTQKGVPGVQPLEVYAPAQRYRPQPEEATTHPS